MFQGPSIREVQAAIGDLREASLCVVEVIQAWRRARQGEIKMEKKGDGSSKDPSVTSSGDVGSDHEPSLRDASAAGEMSEVRESPEVKFPVVPHARPVFAGHEDLPVFLWLPPAVHGRESGGDVTSASRRSSFDPETAVPEKVGHDLNGDAFASAAVKPNRHRHSDNNTLGSTAPAKAYDGHNDAATNDKALLAHHAPSGPRTQGINYLARMVTDTDFIGTPGSVLADFFPPDTKLFRNPFVLGHNLDDTLAVFADGKSPRDGGVETAGSSSAALKKSRLDTRRVRHAAATIVAEEARERAGKATKRHRDERGEGKVENANKDSDGVPSDLASKGGEAGYNTTHDDGRSDRPDSGCSRDTDGDHGGSDERSKKRRGKGGITFEDQQGKGRPSHGVTLCAVKTSRFHEIFSKPNTVGWLPSPFFSNSQHLAAMCPLTTTNEYYRSGRTWGTGGNGVPEVAKRATRRVCM